MLKLTGQYILISHHSYKTKRTILKQYICLPNVGKQLLYFLQTIKVKLKKGKKMSKNNIPYLDISLCQSRHS